MDSNNKVLLFVHNIWGVKNREPLLSKPIRVVLFSHIQKNAAEKGTRILIMNGVEDHVHCLLQLYPSQNLSQVVKNIKLESSLWLNENQVLKIPFEWEGNYAAYSVSPGSIQQVRDYIEKQEEYHKTKTLENELEVFDKARF